jgi:hypothetical protein
MQTGRMDMNDWGDMDQKTHLVLHEHHDRKLDAILEYVRDIPGMKQDITSLKARMDSVEIKLDALSFNVKELNKDMKAVKAGLTRLEAR